MSAQDKVMIKNALMSCHEKAGLKYFASELVKINPGIMIYCSSGTFNELKKAVDAKNLVEISEYTGTKEMPSGLVKTLHPKVHSGILADANDEAQKKYVADVGGVLFDLVVANLYPFAAASEGGSIEKARKNIDIGGVSLIEAAAKNFLRVAVVVSPVDYERVLEMMRGSKGSVDMETRLMLAKSALGYIAAYLDNISGYYERLKIAAVRKEYAVE